MKNLENYLYYNSEKQPICVTEIHQSIPLLCMKMILNIDFPTYEAKNLE